MYMYITIPGVVMVHGGDSLIWESNLGPGYHIVVALVNHVHIQEGLSDAAACYLLR